MPGPTRLIMADQMETSHPSITDMVITCEAIITVGLSHPEITDMVTLSHRRFGHHAIIPGMAVVRPSLMRSSPVVAGVVVAQSSPVPASRGSRSP